MESDTMNGEFNPHDISRQLGLESVDHMLNQVEAFRAHEARRIELTNQATILSLNAEYSLCLENEDDLKERLRHAPPPGDLRSRCRKALYYWAITAVLVGAGTAFALLAFAPFRLGRMSYVYCLGIGLVTPFLVDKILESWDSTLWMKWIATFAGAAALVSLVLLAVIRGDLLAQEIKTMTSVVVEDGAPVAAPESTFYDGTLGFLRLAMLLLSLAMEMGAGIALHDARRLASDCPENWDGLRRELLAVQRRMTALVYEITALQNEAQVFSERFWRNFYEAMLTRTAKSAMTKLLILTIAVLCLIPRARAQEGSAWVIAVDLTQSVAVRTGDQEPEFKKNIDGVARTLGSLPKGAHVTVVGITDKSFVESVILLSAQLPDDAGYFNERLAASRNQLLQAWRVRSQRLEPTFAYTDILGALLLTSQIFDRVPEQNRRVLVIFSDMRHHTRNLDLESPRMIPDFDHVPPDAKALAARLPGVEVYALGVDGAGQSIEYWQALRRFWIGYFHAAGATLKSYSVLRDIPPTRLDAR
jgi:hypothetical protein